MKKQENLSALEIKETEKNLHKLGKVFLVLKSMFMATPNIEECLTELHSIKLTKTIKNR